MQPAEERQIPRKYPIWLGIILALYLLVTAAYGAVNPIFEAPDEQFHYYTVELIRQTRQLPFVPAGEIKDEWISQEAAQPPLYYLLSAALIAPIDSSNAREAIWPNKYQAMGNASKLNNRNIFIHTSSEAWPWKGYALAVHVLRLFSTLLGLGTLLFIYGSGRLVWPADPYRALLAVGLAAFLPQFNFLFASVSNDPLIILLCAAALWQLMHMWKTGVSASRLLLVGLTVGLAMLSKNAGTILLIYAVGFISLLALRDWPLSSDRDQVTGPTLSSWRMVGSMVVFLIIPALLIGGWILVRNQMLYNDFTATNQFLRFSSGDREYTLPQVLGESGGLWLSLIAVFGWFNIRPPDWVYWFWNGLALVAIAGAIWSWIRREKNGGRTEAANQEWKAKLSSMLRHDWALPALLAGWVVLIYISLIFFMLKTEAAQGRLLFPALVPLALGVTYGWTAERRLRRFSLIPLPIAFGITLYCLFLVIRPVFAIPAVVTSLPDDAPMINIDMGQGLMLVGGTVDTQVAKAGDAIWLTLYWQANPVPEQEVEQVTSIFGRDFTEIGKLHTYHGRGLYPANLWPEDVTIVDKFAVQLQNDVAAPVLARVETGIAGEGFSYPVGEVKILPEEWPDPIDKELGLFGEGIKVTDVTIQPDQARPGETVDLQVQWQVLAGPQRDFTTLMHLGQSDQPPLAVGDSPPVGGMYPTRAWEPGEVINDHYALTLPPNLTPGRYPVWLGMYDSQTLERLPVTVQGEAQTNRVMLAAWVEIQ